MDGWDNTTRLHVVKFIAILKEFAVFLDSRSETKQTSKAQAQLLEEVLQPYEGVKAFAAVASDNKQCCINMREIIVNDNRGIVSLNDRPLSQISLSPTLLKRHFATESGPSRFKLIIY